MTTLVLLPGMDGTGTLFDPLLAALGPALTPQVLRYPPDAPLGYAELEDRVAAELPRDRPYVLLGESFSGPIAIALAARRPPHLRGLILCCSFAVSPLPALAWMPEAWIAALVRLTPYVVLRQALMGGFTSTEGNAAFDQALAPVAPAVMAHRARAALTVDRRPELERIEVPMVYLQAEHDRVVGAGAAAAIQARAPQMGIERFDAPHFLLQSRPQEAAAAIERFTRGLGTAP